MIKLKKMHVSFLTCLVTKWDWMLLILTDELLSCFSSTFLNLCAQIFEKFSNSSLKGIKQGWQRSVTMMITTKRGLWFGNFNKAQVRLVDLQPAGTKLYWHDQRDANSYEDVSTNVDSDLMISCCRKIRSVAVDLLAGYSTSVESHNADAQLYMRPH